MLLLVQQVRRFKRKDQMDASEVVDRVVSRRRIAGSAPPLINTDIRRGELVNEI